jgi:hypothetical protein
MDRQGRSYAIKSSPRGTLVLFGRKSSASRVPTNETGLVTLKQVLLTNDLQNEFVELQEIAADHNKMANCLLILRAERGILRPTSSRQDFWVELIHSTIPSYI